jgi:two-component system invasion response regulator UvrY
MKQISILIADDHKLIREIWSYILNADNRFKVIAEAESGELSIELAKKLNPDIIIMDINLPGLNGIDATEQIIKFNPAVKILAISLHTQPLYAKAIMKKGAMGYVTKNSTKDEMMHAIVQIMKGVKYICKEIKNNLTDQIIENPNNDNGFNLLSPRELQIIQYIKQGLSSREIAASLKISEKTVEVHRYNSLKKLKLKNSAALVNYINTQYPNI